MQQILISQFSDDEVDIVYLPYYNIEQVYGFNQQQRSNRDSPRRYDPSSGNMYDDSEVLPRAASSARPRQVLNKQLTEYSDDFDRFAQYNNRGHHQSFTAPI